MRAAEYHRYGGVDVVELHDVQKPVPTGDQVLVKIQAASVNRADLDALIPKPQFVRLFMGLRAPRDKRLGVDAAGVVEAVGPAVTQFKPGDRVFGDMFGYAGGGGFAEYTCVPAKALLEVPSSLSMQVAATLPHSGVLAIQGLRLRNGQTIRPGDKVLIDGASGNVGPFAVQIAKSRGAEVTGVASTEKLDFVRSLGADHVIDYTTTDYTMGRERYDWIVDTDSHHSVFAVRRALNPNGVYVTLGGTGWSILGSLLVAPLVARLSGTRMGLLIWWKPFNRADVETLTGLVQQGKVIPRIDRRYPLGEIVDALRYVDDGHAEGKVVVTVEQQS
jgi:NADPH:quinone reductase-like Zn-dependent oxidoreductase